MANKRVPESISGVELHPCAKERTRELLNKLEIAGVTSISIPGLSMIDRFRLLASAYFTNVVEHQGIDADAPCCGNCECEDPTPSFGDELAEGRKVE